MSDTKVWVETILPQPVCIPTRQNGEVVIYMGTRFSTSDYGDGAVDMRAYLLNGACLNGMVRESVMKQVHLGSKLPDNLQLSERTYQARHQNHDVGGQRPHWKFVQQREHHAKGRRDTECKRSQRGFRYRGFAKLVKNNKLLKAEGEQVQKLLMNNNPDDGGTRRRHPLETDTGHHGTRTRTGTAARPGTARNIRGSDDACSELKRNTNLFRFLYSTLSGGLFALRFLEPFKTIKTRFYGNNIRENTLYRE